MSAPAAKKRKTEATSQDSPSEGPTIDASPSGSPKAITNEDNTLLEQPSAKQPAAADPGSTAAARLARFRALQSRAKASTQSNLRAATKEAAHLSANPALLASLERKKAAASSKLARAEIEESGEDFERKRAWDWTVDESEAWDKRTRKKEARRQQVAFNDYTQEANKVYKRQVRNMAMDEAKSQYDKDKAAEIERAARAGELEIVELEDGEMVAVDKNGTFFGDKDSMEYGSHRPDKAALERVVKDVEKADEQRMKKRRERMARNGQEDGDTTYINEKNKQFNQKLARFYDKYTGEIRDSFERGTMI